MISFFKTALHAPTPSRSNTGIQLRLPNSITILPQKIVHLDLLYGVKLPPLCFGLLSINQQALRPNDKLALHTDVIGK